MIENAGKTAAAVVEGLHHQPLALALVVINILFLLGGAWLLKDISASIRATSERNYELVEKLVQQCIQRN